MKEKLKNLIIKTGKKILRISSIPPDIKLDNDFMRIYSKCKPYTMVSIRRSFALYKAVNYIIDNNIDGDFVECGVWKGGQAMIIAESLLVRGVSNRSLYLYDTFTGMSEPTEKDKNLVNGATAKEKWKKENKSDYNQWCYSPFEEVKENMELTGYPKNNIKFVKGKVEETIPKIIPEKIALLRLDTDWYESTLHELKNLFPLLILNGVVVIDDYGSWKGSKEAVDEYILENDICILLHRIDSSCVGVKT